MTYEQYWYYDPLMVRAFYKADKLKQSKEDYMAWLTGVYIKNALEATVGNMFKSKGSDPIDYPKQPYSFDESTEAEKSAQEDYEEAFAKLYMYNMVRAGKEWGNH